MSEMNVAPKIQDFIVQIGKSENLSSKVEYEVVLENSCDFVIARKTAKTHRTMAIIVSQNLFYLKDDKTNQIEQINYDNIKTYLKDLGERVIELNSVNWIKKINRYSYEAINRVIFNSSSIEMCKHNIYFPAKDMLQYIEFAQNDITFLEYIFNSIPNLDDTYKFDRNFIEFAYLVKDNLGTNEAKYFVEKYIDSSISKIDFFASRYGHNDIHGIVWRLVSDDNYKIDFRRFIEYLFFDIYAQGKFNLNYEFFRKYIDYLDMQIDLYGEIKEKYPKYFETAHDVLTLKTSLKSFKIEEEKFKKEMEKYKDLEYSDSRYLIRIPKIPEELKKEGENLNHCVGGYGNRVANGQCGVVFLREKDFEEKSLVTIEVIKDRVVQMQGGDRRKLSSDEMRFIKKWAIEKNLRLCA